MKTVLIYVNTSAEVGDVDHLKVFANEDAADAWFKENRPRRRRVRVSGSWRGVTGSAAEAALLLLLWMEYRFLGFHFFNQFADALGQQWIAHPRGKLSVVLDLLVEFFAPVTHARLRIGALAVKFDGCL